MLISLEKEFNSVIPANYVDSILCSSYCAEKYGIKIFLIGGIVRDLILKNQIKDIDIAVEGNAIDFAQYLESLYGCEIISIQENLKTAKVIFQNGVIIDFASTREEKYSQSGVLPIAYNFGCELQKDVRRRDFSINTLAISLTGSDKFSLVDNCNGYDDIKNKKIRVLHRESFNDDPSRIIRALKFKERFDFCLDEETQRLMQEYLNNINDNMPLERIKNELRQYFEIKKTGLYQRFIESNAYKLISDNPIRTVDESRINSLYRYDLFCEDELWFIYIVLLVLNSEYALKRLNMNSFEKKIIKEVNELMKKNITNSKVEIYNIFKNMTDLSICVYYIITGNSLVKVFLEALKDIKVLTTGKDLIELGFIPSPYFNKLFDAILKEKLDGKLQTKEEEITFVKQFLGKIC